ncbi:MAG: alpha/beta hydrolase [Clostridiales bacterium]|nr:alpha/beta hydrolase [Clostridiales bacterium]
MKHTTYTIRWTSPKQERPAPLRVKLKRRQWAISDGIRNRGLTTPEDVVRYDDLSYGPLGHWHRFDLYTPREFTAPLPVIVSVHGGGYFYGSKEIYQYYCMDLARRGFAVVNFNYRLAPEFRFPAPLEDTNAMLTWVCAHAAEYDLDTGNLFLVGDSAGAQLASHYAAAWADREYADQLGLSIPDFRLAALGLNCGMYDLQARAKSGQDGNVMTDYLGPDLTIYGDKLDVLSHISADYPPTYLISAPNDFLCDQCQPMAVLLQSRGVETRWKLYGTVSQREVAHVFHVNLRLPEATQANDDQIAFFRAHLQ